MDARSTGIDALTARFTPGRPAVVCYVPLGDPIARPSDLLDAYADAGVDVLEVGIPSEHPWLDGAEVTESMARALAVGTSAASIASVLGAWRRRRVATGVPVPAILWFAYPELPVAAIRDAAEAIDALLMIEPYRHREAATLEDELGRMGIARSAFLPWTPTPADEAAAATVTGYLMVQARPGPTGAGGPVADPAPLVRRARSLAPGRPVVTGFGIEGPHDVTRVLRSGVDGVVVGSACIRALRDGGMEALSALLRAIVATARATAIPATRA